MEKIAVAVRFRPATTTSSADTDSGRQWQIDGNRISVLQLSTPLSGSSFSFDHVFDHGSTNSTIYNLLIKSIIHAAIDGFNGTAFAYGQTSSGKTYTMNGSENEPGIIPLAVRDIFDIARKTTDREFLIRVSYMEIYNEEINDLLTLGSQKLPIHESLERGVFVAGLREEIVNNAEQVLDLLKIGEANRHFGETNMNVRSSRSHTIFQMVIESSAKDTTTAGDLTNADAIRVSVLNLVDLAGSERIAKTGAGGVRLKEGKYINKSLMILGNVINKLSENGKQRGHIPYRDSKLTRILQPALGGNAKTSIICTVAPEEVHIEETRGTLQFASRAKRVTNCAQVNEILTDAALLKRQKLEIEELRRKLQGSHSEVLEQVILKQRNDMHKSELERERLAVELDGERKSREALESQVSELRKKIDDLGNLSISGKSFEGVERSATPSESHTIQFNDLKTPNFKNPPNGFVAKRSNFLNYSNNGPDLSPVPDNFADVADEDLWSRLNKGCFTDLDAHQMTPGLPCQPFVPREISMGLPMKEEEKSDAKICRRPEEECNSIREKLDELKIQILKLEQERNLLKEEKEGLIQDLTKSKQENELLKIEKEGLNKEINTERKKLNEIKEDFRVVITKFTQKENLLTALRTKTKAIVENTNASRVALV